VDGAHGVQYVCTLHRKSTPTVGLPVPGKPPVYISSISLMYPVLEVYTEFGSNVALEISADATLPAAVESV